MKKQSAKVKRYTKSQLKRLKDQTEYKRLDSMSDEDIDYSDIPDMEDEFWAKAKVIDPGPKKAVSLRIDPDVLDWFKHQRGRYQYLMNQVLRRYMNVQKRKHEQKRKRN